MDKLAVDEAQPHKPSVRTSTSVWEFIIIGKRYGPSRCVLESEIIRVALPDPAIQVWQVNLDFDAEQVEQCSQLLSSDERSRATRFHLQHDRRRFVVARGMLRVLLGKHFDVEPGMITFAYTERGKPLLAGPAQIHFNVSHSSEKALYALSASHHVGIDIEYAGRDFDFAALARRFLTRAEEQVINALPESRRRRAFLTCWTRKEAVAKALGGGLSLAFDELEVTAASDATPSVLAGGTCDAQSWILYAVDTAADYVAAVARTTVVAPAQSQN